MSWEAGSARLARPRRGEPGVASPRSCSPRSEPSPGGRRALLVTGEESAGRCRFAPRDSVVPSPSRSWPRPSSTWSCATSTPSDPTSCVATPCRRCMRPRSVHAGLGRSGARSGRGICASRRRRTRHSPVGHVTKDGTVAGPRVLEHLVDCVLSSKGTVTTSIASARDEETVRLDERARRVRDDASGLVGVPDPRSSSGRRGGRGRAAVACAPRGSRLCSSRFRHSSRGPIGDAPSGRHRSRPEAARDGGRRARPSCGACRSRAGRVRPSRAASGSRSRGADLAVAWQSLGRSWDARARAPGRVRRDRLTGRLAQSSQAERGASRGVRQAGIATVVAPAGTPGRTNVSRRRSRDVAGRRSRQGWRRRHRPRRHAVVRCGDSVAVP